MSYQNKGFVDYFSKIKTFSKNDTNIVSLYFSNVFKFSTIFSFLLGFFGEKMNNFRETLNITDEKDEKREIKKYINRYEK